MLFFKKKTARLHTLFKQYFKLLWVLIICRICYLTLISRHSFYGHYSAQVHDSVYSTYGTELCIGPSGFLMPYQMGLFSALLEDAEVRVLLRTVKITGISGGAGVGKTVLI